MVCKGLLSIRSCEGELGRQRIWLRSSEWSAQRQDENGRTPRMLTIWWRRIGRLRAGLDGTSLDRPFTTQRSRGLELAGAFAAGGACIALGNEMFPRTQEVPRPDVGEISGD